MTNKLKILTIISGCILCMVSCVSSLETLNLEILKPATISIDPEILSVVIVDKSEPYRDENVHTVVMPKETISLDTIWVDNFSQIAVESMSEALKSKMFFDAVFLHDENEEDYIIDKGYIPDYELIDIIEDLCYIYDAQAVIFLESYKYKTKLSLSDLGYVYYGSLDANGSVFWKMYDQHGELIDMFLQSDSIFWDKTGNRFANILQELPEQTSAVEILAEYFGETYISRISPFWDIASRKYFSKGHHYFERANSLHKIGNWDEAAKVWYYVYESGNPPQKAKAAFNIALSYEVRGNFDEAVAWSEISYKLFRKMGAFRSSNYEKIISYHYYFLLNERQQQKDKLDEQIGM
ncbi:MAG: tetratricopeptide repeat protein [Marinilabiliaceae bacterium]|nr:tetratricopeptide repeat protein [Marinilabiliaceae bacterium]